MFLIHLVFVGYLDLIRVATINKNIIPLKLLKVKNSPTLSITKNVFDDDIIDKI
jgi:hypothetical protein